MFGWFRKKKANPPKSTTPDDGFAKKCLEAVNASTARPSTTYEVADIYKQLRDRAFHAKPGNPEALKSVAGSVPFGILMETGYPQAVITLVAYDTGDASLYFSNGGGVIGGIGHETVQVAARQFVNKARASIQSMSKSRDTSLPPLGIVRFHVLTTDGVITTEASENDLGNGGSGLSPLFYAGQEVITQLRLATEKAEPGPSGRQTQQQPPQGLNSDRIKGTPSSDESPQELHNRLYKEGCDQIMPYMQLDGTTRNKADSSHSRRELTQGIGNLQRVVQMNPDNWAAHWIIGKAYQALGDSNAACASFASAYAIHKDNPDVAREYMYECLNLGKGVEAVSLALAALRLRPEDPGLKANLALAQLIAGEVDGAIIAVAEAIKLDPTDKITQNLQRCIQEVKAGTRVQPRRISDIR